MKEVLAESYPQVDEENRESLPPAALEILKGSSQSAPEKSSWPDRLRSLLHGPQLMGLGAAAVLILSVVFLYPRHHDTPGNEPNTVNMRSGQGGEIQTLIVVLRGLTPEQISAVQESGFFKEPQLLILKTGETLPANLANQLVVVDGSQSLISSPSHQELIGEHQLPEDIQDLPSLLLDLIAELPTDSEQ